MKNIEDLERIIYPNKLNEIKYFLANINKTKVLFIDNRIVVSGYNLAVYEKIICMKKGFLRIHNSYIVNLDFIVKIDEKAGFLKLKNNEALPIGNGYLKKMKEILMSNNTK